MPRSPIRLVLTAAIGAIVLAAPVFIGTAASAETSPTTAPGPGILAASPTPAGANYVSPGSNHACAIKGNKSLQCWGNNSFGQATPPSGSFFDVAAGTGFTCAIEDDGDSADGGPVECWGTNDLGQTDAPSGTDFIQIETSQIGTCARHADWILECWGSVPSGVPTTAVFDFDINNGHGCAILSGGPLECWGFDFYGQVSDPNAETGRYSAVSVGLSHTCAIRDTSDSSNRTIQCWGDNTFGQTNAPAGAYTRLASTKYLTTNCAIAFATAAMSCWGDGSSTPSGTYQRLDAGAVGLCAITSAAQVECWPFNSSGEAAPFATQSTMAGASAGVAYDSAFPITYISPTPTYAVTGDLPDGLSYSNGGLTGTPLELGEFTFTARSTDSVMGVEANFTITVSPGPVTSVELEADPTSATQGDTAGLALIGYDGIGTRIGQIVDSYTLESDDPSDTFPDLEHVTFDFDPADVVTTSAVHTITATYGSLTSDAEITVEPLVETVELTIDPSSLVVNGTAVATLTGLDADGDDVADLTQYSSFSSSVGSDTVDEDEITTSTLGARTITGTYGTLSDTAGLVATVGPLDSIVVTPSATTADTDDTVTFSVEGFDEFGNSLGDVTTSATFSSSVTGDTVTDDEVTFTFDAAAGTTVDVAHTITATIGAITGTTSVTVAPLITDLALEIDPGTLVVNSTAVATVTGLNADGDPVADLTDYSTISSSNPDDTVDGNEVTSSSLGARTVTAAYGTLTASGGLVATVGPLASVVVTPSATTSATDESVTVSVEGFDEFGNSLGDVTPAAVITSSIPGDTVAGTTVTFALDLAAAATTTVDHVLTATLGVVSGSTNVTVTPLIVELEFTLSSTAATVGDTITVSVEGKDASGEAIADLDDFVTITSDQEADVVDGLHVTFTHASPHVITATYGTLSASGTVEVSPAAVQPTPQQLALTGLVISAVAPLGLGLLSFGVLVIVVTRIRRREEQS